ncbi:MAG: hypothetical protein ABI591_25165 [Kofleriaceae bacterium]
MKWLCLIVLVACGTDDPRPATLDVIATEILAPACGAPQCHSTSTLQSGYAFDTLAAAKLSLQSLQSGGGRGHRSLMEELSTRRMPPDAPVDDADLKLIETWIAAGSPGL